jgi:selT/selW/selH-like putative selenoprotein
LSGEAERLPASIRIRERTMLEAQAVKSAPAGDAVRIEYCVSCGFLAQATHLAGSVLNDFAERLPSGVTVVAGEEGSFEVNLNDRLGFSMLDKARSPESQRGRNQAGRVARD